MKLSKNREKVAVVVEEVKSEPLYYTLQDGNATTTVNRLQYNVLNVSGEMLSKDNTKTFIRRVYRVGIPSRGNRRVSKLNWLVNKLEFLETRKHRILSS